MKVAPLFSIGELSEECVRRSDLVLGGVKDELGANTVILGATVVKQRVGQVGVPLDAEGLAAAEEDSILTRKRRQGIFNTDLQCSPPRSRKHGYQRHKIKTCFRKDSPAEY